MSLRADIAALSVELERMQGLVSPSAAGMAADPARLMEEAGMEPDDWQRDVSRDEAPQTLLLCTRQGGKSTVTAAKALHLALFQPGSLSLLLSPSLRQSQELFLKVTRLYADTGQIVPTERYSALSLELVNGSRVVALPGSERTVRGLSGVDLLVIDEASRVLDDLYYSVRPMLTVSGGQLIALTTPWGKRGFFWREWTEGGLAWKRVRITADDCPRIPRAFLEEERRRLPDPWYRSEYGCEFTDTVESVFCSEDIEAAFTGAVRPLFPPQKALLPVEEDARIRPL
jgi:hypothetical protein